LKSKLFFYRDENWNSPKLQGGKDILTLIIKVDLNINNPIIPGIHIGNTIDGTTWVDFCYENLPQLCFNCGMVGHPEKFCRNNKLIVEEAAPLGPWIRSNIYGRRIIDPKDRKNFNNPSLAKKSGHSSPSAPEDLLQQLADLRIQEARNQQAEQNPLKRQYDNTYPTTSYSSYTLNPLLRAPSQSISMDWSENNNHSCV